MFEPVKAKLICLEASYELEFPYNPKELSIERQSGFSAKDKGGGPWGGIRWECAKPDKLSFEFVLDATEPSTGLVTAGLMLPISSTAAMLGMLNMDNVLKQIKTLHQMTIPHWYKKDVAKRPPFCAFLWGNFQFFGGIESITSKCVLFDVNGLPKRAEVNLSMIGQAMHAPSSPEELTGMEDGYSYKTLSSGRFTSKKMSISMDPRVAMLGSL